MNNGGLALAFFLRHVVALLVTSSIWMSPLAEFPYLPF
jgi:hypothetical protein